MKTINAIQSIPAYVLLTMTSAVFSQCVQAQHTHSMGNTIQASPYAGEQVRALKSLSDAEVKGLVSGAGMGYAKTAELNGYPGPMHVIELARPLGLSAEQRSASEQLMASHKAKARALGAQLLEAERALDAAFATQQIDAQRLEILTQRIGTVQATLRAEHLRTHIQQTALLKPEQIVSYQNLRGYNNAHSSAPHANH